MRRKILFVICIALAAAVLPASARKRGTSAVTVGIRQHAEARDDADLPFGESDLSYLLAYEYHEQQSYWQMGLGYTPHSSTTSTVDSVVTPQVHLLYKDQMLWGGVGLMRSYVRDVDPYWTGFFWQAQVGIHLPLSDALDLQMGGYYLFEDWGDLGDFDFDGLEMGASISYSF